MLLWIYDLNETFIDEIRLAEELYYRLACFIRMVDAIVIGILLTGGTTI